MKKVIYCKDVERIVKLPTSNGQKVFIGIYGNNSKIFVSFWINGYKDLMKLIIDNCSNNKDICIDPRVIEILEKSN